MAQKIIGIDGMSIADLHQAVDEGGRFVIYQYTISIIIMTFRRSTNIHFIPTSGKRVAKGIPLTILSAILGWWGIPWGPIYTVGVIIDNLSGGKNVTKEVMASIDQSSVGGDQDFWTDSQNHLGT